MKRCILILALAIFASAEMLQPRRLIDAPTAGALPKASFDLEFRVHPSGDTTLGTGLILGIAVGLTDRLNIGISYGGEGLVGRGPRARFNPIPGVMLKYRLFEEGYLFPGLAFGYEHQGYGGLADTATFGYTGYICKSPGFFVAMSKNYQLLSTVQLGFHGIANLSMEEFEKVRWPNAVLGFDLGFNEELALVLEYDLGTNIRDIERPGQPMYYGRPQDGFLNAGIRWAFSESFYLEFDTKDLLENRHRKDKRAVGWTRELKLSYYSQF